MKKGTYIIAAAVCLAGVLAYFIMAGSRKPEIRNIILISIDTCRADYLSCYGYLQKTTPHIDAVAEGATRFENVISPAPITLPAHSSMLTGTTPPFHGVHNNTGYQLAPSNLTLAEILQQDGFTTAAIVSAFVLDGNRGLTQGFDTYYDSFSKRNYNRDIEGNERKGGETTQLALNWLDQNKEGKSFLFLHYYDPHLDYSPPEPFASDFADNPYAGEIAFTDHCIGRVVRKLKEIGLYDSTLLIITGDHGEMLGEHGEDEHSYFIYESAIKVPLIIKLPRQAKGLAIAQPVGLVDIVPTLCSLLDIDIPSRIQGQDISSMLHGTIPDAYERHLYSESVVPTYVGASSLMAISTGRWKYIQAPRPELYDLASDPAEECNLIGKESHRARILEDRLRETLEQSVRKTPDSRIQLDAASIKRLESLGYVAGKAEGEIVFDANKDDPKDLIYVYTQYHRARKLIDTDKEDEKAKKILLELIPLHPEYYRIYLPLGDIAMREGDLDQALGYYRRAIELDPQKITDKLYNNLAWIQATNPSITTRDVDEAVEFAKRVCERTNFNNPYALDTLAVAYAAAGNFQKALETDRKAQRIASSANHTRLVQKIDARLKLFARSKPYTEPPLKPRPGPYGK